MMGAFFGPSLAPQQNVDGAGTAVVRLGRAKRDDLLPPGQPPVHSRFQDRPPGSGAEPFAVHHSHARQAGCAAFLDEAPQFDLRFNGRQPVQIDFFLYCVVAAP
jgi:hypothetical protein